MRFILTVLLLVAVVLIVADALRHDKRHNNRPSLKHVSCQRVKDAGVCERCCDPCKDVKCCEPLTCSGGECKCNGEVCGENQDCTMVEDSGSGSGVATCVNKVQMEERGLPGR
ncbi:hypothetical protein SNE40_017115 [Patella caerulea]|uniref:Uncharacterized protein n=1 Tax=Patella caerulea TaxID=87958 RepID=A0AAN8JD87_PATCE